MSKVEKEIRLDLLVNGTVKTFTQSHVPYSKSLDYTDGEAELFKEGKDGKIIQPSERSLAEYRAKFVADLFDDKDLTVEVLLEGMDAIEKDTIMDIILYRVLGYEKPQEEVIVDPKEKK
ncbi:MAG: hypothetical protein LKF43_00175 [Streptococcaceae bacterium]|jgi:hypothetical protein|nr:hypothetical protein [Streptococcaceae bacterium]